MKIKIKKFMFKVLTGMSLGIIVPLVPGAIIGELSKHFGLIGLAEASAVISSLVPVAIGIGIAYQFKLLPLESLSLMLATFIGSGVYKVTNGVVALKGTGDVINAGITACIALIILKLIRGKLNSLNIIIFPLVIGVFGGVLGSKFLPFVKMFSKLIGDGIKHVVELEPLLMGGLLAVIFGIIIVSPLSSVAVAIAVNLTGIASGTANLGIATFGIGLAIIGLRVNGIGISIVPVIGSPKIYMVNFIKKPLILLPMCVNAFIVGVIGAMYNIQGTPTSAGFGLSGLIGPTFALNALSWTGANIILVTIIFLVIPTILTFIGQFIFIKKLKIITEEDYRIKI